MPGRADGDEGMVNSHAKKRELDTALGLGTGIRDAKRRHTAGGPGHHHDGSTSNSPSLRPRGQDFKSSKFQHDTGPFSSRPSNSPVPKTQHSLRPPNSGHSAAKASGAPGSSGNSWGAKPSSLGGLFSGRGQDKSHQNSVPNGPPNSSSTSSDASSIPAGSTPTFPALVTKNIPQKTSSNSLRYGDKSASRAVAREGNPQNHNTEDVVLGSQRRQSGPQDRLLPSSHRHNSRNTIWSLSTSLNSSSDEDFIPEGGFKGSSDKGDDYSTTFPKPGQRSARLRARSSGGSLLDSKHGAAHFHWDKTPSGKDYNEFSDETWKTGRANFAIFPDGYKLQQVEDSTSTTPSDLDRALTDSKVWAYVAPLVSQTWTASITDGLETSAFIQAISLPLRNKMDMEWLAGTKKSHQRGYRALMSVIFLAIGVEARCKPCESKIPERQRNCKVLPPEAEGMRELQEVYGSQCVNCYFFQATKPCEFPTSSVMTKQTPIPVPTPPSTRPMPNIERSLDPSPAAGPPPAASRPPVPSYSSYKATTAEKPISESPVPIPLFANRGSNHQVQSSQKSAVSANKSDTGIPRGTRRSGRVARIDDQSGGSSIYKGRDNTDQAESHSAALTSDGLSSSVPSSKESTAVASSLPSDDISGSQLAGRAFSLFGDISRLPAEEQAALWSQMQQMAGMLQTGPATSSSLTKSTYPGLLPGPLASEWEIAPGRLIVDDKHVAFSTSFLSREVISVKAAQQLSPTQRVLNKSIAALHQLSVCPEDDWDCTCSVIRGVLKVKVGDLRANIGQGGVLIIERECIITNISHKEARIQMWWKRTDD